MSLGEFALCKHAQSVNALNLEKNVNNCYLLRKRAFINEKAQLDLNHSILVFGMLMLYCPVDSSSTITDNGKV